MIDKNRVKQQFANYTSTYDTSDEKIKLKIDHTYRVAGLCERLAISEGFEERETELAWLLGMLHDVGRFEQLRRYGTFVDADSIDHAEFGADILFGKAKGCTEAGDKDKGGENKGEEEEDRNGEAERKTGSIRDYLEDPSEDVLIETAIRVHSVYRIPEDLDARTKRFCNILRDADKIDILKVNVDVPLESIYNVTPEELRQCEVSEAVMREYGKEHAILRSLKRTPADNIVGHIALVYELIFSESIRIVQEQGYLERLFDYPTQNPQTKAQFVSIRRQMEDYIERKYRVQI